MNTTQKVHLFSPRLYSNYVWVLVGILLFRKCHAPLINWTCVYFLASLYIYYFLLHVVLQNH